MATKTSRKKEKTFSSGKVKGTPDVTVIKNHVPCEEEIRVLAEILYQQRITRGESGTDLDDWYKAEEYIKYQDFF